MTHTHRHAYCKHTHNHYNASHIIRIYTASSKHNHVQPCFSEDTHIFTDKYSISLRRPGTHSKSFPPQTGVVESVQVFELL